VIERLVLFGATGDLAGRYLLPAIAALRAAGTLPDAFEVVGTGREPIDAAAFRQLVAAHLAEHASHVPSAARDAVVQLIRYRPADIAEGRSVAALFDRDAPVAVYLALPPSVFPAAVTSVADVGLPTGSRIVLEKPFGEDLEGAVALNRLLARAVGDAGEPAIYRVDHALGMATVSNLIAMRRSNPVLEAIWNSAHIDRVDVLWEETLSLEGRAGYYDTAGALRDVIQNHVLQVLAVITMELPSTAGERELPARRSDALRSIHPLEASDIALRTRRARYSAGHLAPPPDGSGEAVPAYVDEDGVDPDRMIETFAEVALELDAERWIGTTVVLRAGKALRRRRKMAILRFRDGPPAFAEHTGTSASELSIGIDGPEDIVLRLRGGAVGAPVPVALRAPPPATDLPPYGHVLLDILTGGSALSVGADEAEQAWRIVTPILEAWREGLAPMEDYPAGSTGPRRTRAG
jgi:glucose-6-phosphate 1-dehydrogenase